MFKILVAVDGSTYARHASEFAAKLCSKISDAEATALYVKDLGISYIGYAVEPGINVMPDTAALQEELERISDEALAAAQNSFGQYGRSVILRSEWGRPSDVICEIAEREGFDLIVVGSRGMGHIAGMLLGSVSDRVAHRATVPVVIVRG